MKKNKPAESIIAISGGMIVFYLIYKVTVLLFIALGFIVVGLMSSFLTSKIAWLWLSFAKTLGYFSSRIILCLVYFLILTPIAMLRKIFGNKTNVVENASRYFIREHIFTKNDFEKPF